MQHISEYQGLFEDTDFIKASKFIDHFKNKADKSPYSLFFQHIVDDTSPFRYMLGMNNVFVVRNEGEALFSARKEKSARMLDESDIK